MKKLLLICVFVLTLSGCSLEKTKVPTEKTSFLLNTISKITIYDMAEEEASDIINECFALSRDYERKLSKTEEKSDVWRINHSNGNWVNVSDDTIFLLSMGRDYSLITDG